MSHILVVDDEPMICEGIADYLMNSDLNISQVHVALNGFEALDYIRMEPIELVLTDMQMGEMNGIQLMEAIAIEQPDLPIVVISAHENFHYAQQAVRYGAKDYLIKPVGLDQLNHVVKHHLGLKNKRQTEWINDVLDKYSVDSLLKNSLLSELIYEPVMEDRTIRKMFKQLGVNLNGTYFGLFAAQLIIDPRKLKSYKMESFLDRSLLKFAVANIMEETFSEQNCIVFDAGENMMVAIIQWDENSSRNVSAEYVSKLHLLAGSMHSNLRQYLKIDSTIGISRIGHKLESLPALFKESMEAVGWKKKHPDQHVFYIDDYTRYTRAGSLELGETDMKIIQTVQDYLRESFRKHDLKLQEIAKVVHLSPNYLSYQFSKLVGVNLWDYVTRLRMEEAAKLLRTTDMKRYEIAYHVGYESPEHFGRIFKRFYGISPNEYRETNQ